MKLSFLPLVPLPVVLLLILACHFGPMIENRWREVKHDPEVLQYDEHLNSVAIDGARAWKHFYETSPTTILCDWIVYGLTFGRARLAHTGYYQFETLQKTKKDAIVAIVLCDYHKNGLSVVYQPVSDKRPASHVAEFRSKFISSGSSTSTMPADCHYLNFDGNIKAYYNWYGGNCASPSEIAIWVLCKYYVLAFVAATLVIWIGQAIYASIVPQM